MMKQIHAVRHGEYDPGDPNQSLIDTGREQALEASRHLETNRLEGTLGCDALILTAKSSRAIQTAEIIAEYLGIERERLLHSNRLTAAGSNEPNGVDHFGGFIERTLEGLEVIYDGLVVVGSEPLIMLANGNQGVMHGEVVVYEYDTDVMDPDPKRYFSPSSHRRLENDYPEIWQ